MAPGRREAVAGLLTRGGRAAKPGIVVTELSLVARTRARKRGGAKGTRTPGLLHAMPDDFVWPVRNSTVYARQRRFTVRLRTIRIG